MKRTFVEFPHVTQVFNAEHVNDEFIRELQQRIMRNEGDVIRGTSGLRKIRCAAAGRGKSGGIRVIFADYPDSGKCLLIAAFAKNVKENLSAAEQNQLGKLKAALDRMMQRGN